jgi:hypothetical protein
MTTAFKKTTTNIIFVGIAIIDPRSPNVLGFEITHTNSPQSLRLLWTRDRHIAETST